MAEGTEKKKSERNRTDVGKVQPDRRQIYPAPPNMPAFPGGKIRHDSRQEPYAVVPHVRIGAGCALQAHEIQLSEMATLIKPNQQSGTESCVAIGDNHCEA